MIRPALALSVSVVLLAWSAPAAARDAGASTLANDDTIPSLVRELSSAERSLSDAMAASDGCAIACRALDSMRRATDRICALEPGAACEDARRRTASAETRVVQSCPCVSADESRAASKADSKRPEPKPAAVPAAETASAPGADVDAAPRRGGCASCATIGERRSARDAAVAWAVALTALAFVRRRRNR